MADYTEVFPLGAGDFTSQASGTITGGDCVAVSGSGTVASAAAGSLLVVGVAGHDAVSGGKITVKPLKKVHESLAGAGGITAGNPLKVGASSNKLVLWVTGTDSAAAFVGIALTTAAQDATLRWIGR
jgi:exosortase/archaeosortase